MIDVRWSARARAEFDAIVDTELARGLSSPGNYSRRIAGAIEQLRQFPFSGVEVPRLSVRRLVVPGTPYTVYYHVTDFEIGLATIRHGAQEPLRHLSRS
jgi:plasmid stabilization system protein ParE